MKLTSIMLMLTSLLLTCPASAQREPGTETPFIGITAVNNYMSSIKEKNESPYGGMNMERYFTTTIVKNIENCTKQAHAVFAKWLEINKLIPSVQKQNETSLYGLVWDRKEKGMFEYGYLVDFEKSYVRLYLDYYGLNGANLAVESIPQMIKAYQLNMLFTQLTGVLECE